MIKFIAFSGLRAAFADEGLPPSVITKLSAINDNAEECRFIVNLGNTVNSEVSEEASAKVLGEVLNICNEETSAHAIMGELDAVITKPGFLKLCNYTTRYRACDVSDYRCIFLDTADDGTIDDEQFGWLSRLLGKSHRPAVIFSHIPLAVSHEAGDVRTVSNSDALCELIERSKKVTLVLQAGEACDLVVRHGVPYITLAPMYKSEEATFARATVSSKGIELEGFGAQKSYSISNIANYEKESEKKRGLFSFFKKK